MDAALPLLLGLFSAITLAIVNTAVKAGTDILVGRAILSIYAAIMVLPAIFYLPWPDAATWRWLAIAPLGHWAYTFALVRAMHRGDLSLVFPVMRGTAPVLTALAAFLFLGEDLSAFSVMGLLIASAALIAFALPEKATSDRPLQRSALFWAAMTALGIALYNVIDAQGTRAAETPYVFIAWLFLIDVIGITSVTLMMRGPRALAAALTVRWRYGLVAGGLSIASYGAALYGFSISNVAMISALRETSVVFAVLMGAKWLKEGVSPRRIAAAGALVAGLVLMQVAG